MPEAKTAVLDTGVLVLLCVGLTDKSLITSHKRLRAFTVDDFDLLLQVLGSVEHWATTPTIAAETSNLLAQIGEPFRRRILSKFSELLHNVIELYRESKVAAAREEFAWLGLTDCAALSVLNENSVLLTADAKLHIAASNAGCSTINFNHLREGRTL